MAYQGKFSQPRNTEEQIRLRKEAQKAAAAAAAAEGKAPAAPAEAPKATPVQEQPQAKKSRKGKKKKKYKGNRTITTIFYTFYFLLLFAMLGGIWYLHGWLNSFLTNYEASQPTTRCREVFDEYFKTPDWAKLYVMANLDDTSFEGVEAFSGYMTQKVDGQEITFVETSAGLSGGHKYLLKLGEETLGYFTMKDNAEEGSTIADWQLSNVVLYYSYAESVTIQKMDGQTVYVNGIALDDSYTVQVGTTLAEEYLPAGLHGPRIYTQYVTGLMQEPVITATDDEGNDIPVSYNEEADIYIVQNESNTISNEEYERAMATAKTYALRMIEKASTNELAKYFDKTSQSYKTIVSIDPWMQEWFFRSYKFENEAITGYYRYSDELFSCHVKVSMFVTRTDDTVKEYEVDHTFFFELQGKTWKCINMTNVDVMEQTASVRLTFMNGETVIFTNLFAEDTTSLQAPTVTAPEGKVFAGWYRQDTAQDGSKTYTLVFSPDENGNVTLPTGTKLVPMTLYALFEDAATDGGNN